MVENKDDLQKLSNRMRSDWDTRIGHDYRFWMSDGTESDQSMWEVGARDFQKLVEEIPDDWRRSATAVELGCGVGRLLRQASSSFASVIGVDVSTGAISEARRLLADLNNVSLVAGDGVTLGGLADGSADFVYSFATFASLPTIVAAHYIKEFARVLRKGGKLRIQVYLGKEQTVHAEDTLAIRSYEPARFFKAMRAAGLELVFSKELILPFEISDREEGVIAYILGFEKVDAPGISPADIYQQMISSPEQRADDSFAGSRTEYLMAISRAEQLMNEGNIQGAAAALQFAVDRYSESEESVKEMLRSLQRMSGKVEAVATNLIQLSARGSRELFERNLEVLERRFPKVAAILRSLPQGRGIKVERASNGSPIIVVDDIPLDNRESPEKAGERLALSLASGSQPLLVLGFAGGYHLPHLLNQAQVYLYEPRPEVLKEALSQRDLREVIERLSGLDTTPDIFENIERLSSEAKLVTHPQTQLASRQSIDQARQHYWSVRGLRELRPAIGVVGPIYGGSLPVARSTASTLQLMKQRTHFLDMNSLQGPYFDVSKYVKNKGRISGLQSTYVEMLSQVVLEAITEKPVDILICLAQAPLSPRVLAEIRSRGIITVMWFVEDCRRFTAWQHIAQFYDYMFLIQKDGFPQLVEQAGAGKAIYLPMACDPLTHRRLNLSEDEIRQWGSDLSFVGAGYNNRQQMFASLATRDFKIWGTEWPSGAPFDRLVQQSGRRISPDEYVKIFNATKINLNLHSSMERDGVEPGGDFVNPRTFELAASGAFQLVDNRTLLPELFDVGSEVITFSDKRELEERIDYFLAHPEKREEVANRAQIRALKNHTYEMRLRDMLGYIYADRYQELKDRAANDGWKKTLESAKPFPELQSRLQAVFERGEDPHLENLVGAIQQGKGALTETEQKLLFLHHIKSQITYINELREGKS